MAVTPHFVYPLRIDGSGHIATVEQDSVDDILSCVYIALKTPRGSRPYVPNFGVDDFTFSKGLVSLTDIQTQIQESEPRADISMSEKINDLIQTVVVGVGNVG
jgi:hypothetical protein